MWGGPQLFAQKLFTLVEEEDPEIVEWLPDGLAFRVKDIERFSTEVLEKYFNRECVRLSLVVLVVFPAMPPHNMVNCAPIIVWLCITYLAG